MTSMISSFTILLLVSCLASLAGAAPTALSKKEVVDPPITSPDASTVWNVGDTQTVTWDTSNIPSDAAGNPGMVVLGFLEDGDDSEHLMLNPPLAQGFNISAGKVNVVVPSLPARNDYIVVLFGDSGNQSPKFTINNGTSLTSSASSSSTSTVPSTATSTQSAPKPATSTIVVVTSVVSSAVSAASSAATTSPISVTSLPVPTISVTSAASIVSSLASSQASSLSASSSGTGATTSISAAQSQGTTSTSAAFPQHVLRASWYLAPLLAMLIML